uniref:WW domain-containing protein n=1 Tax=Aureoumbra lagunensis TaxID=44058 RepID=A0A7S3K5C6_9STRA
MSTPIEELSPRSKALETAAPSIERCKEHLSKNLPKMIIVEHTQLGYRVNKGPSELVQPDTKEKAEPFPFCGSSIWSDMDTFGLGISLYFRQLLFFVVVSLTAAIILIAATSHNADVCRHSGTGKNEKNKGLVIGSAAGCFPKDLRVGDNVVPDLLVCLCILIVTLLANRLEALVETRIDLSQQTPSDYSVQVLNPPEYVDNPDSYYEFFSDFFQNGQNREDVVAVTMSKDNGALIQLLAQRRAYMQDLIDFDARDARIRAESSSSEHEIIHDDAQPLSGFLQFLQPYLYPYGLLKTRAYAQAEKDRIEGDLRVKISLAIEDWKAPRRVVVTFATEASQHRALDAYETSGARRIISNWTGYEFDNNPRQLEGGTVLHVEKPVEPSEIFWHNSHVKFFEKCIRIFITLAITAGMLVIVSVVSIQLRGSWRFTLSVFITLVNATLPPFIKVITEMIERHADFGDLQDSMFLKLTAARWINTAVAVFISYSPRERLSADALSQVMLILLADAFLTPMIRIIDIYDLFLRYFVAPRQPTQRAANRLWTGADWNIAERYTDVSKTLFVGLFYAAAMPTSLFVTAAAMLTTFCADRFCILKKWRRVPELDAQLAKRTIGVVAIIIFVHAWSTMFFFLMWGTYTESFDDDDFNDETGDRAINCFTGLLECRVPNDKVTNAQKIAYQIFRPVGFIAFVVALWKFIGVEIKNTFFDLFCGGNNTQRSEPNLDNFRALSSDVHLYCPAVTHPNLDEPLLAAVVDGVPAHLLPVSDPIYHNVATQQEIAPLLGPDAPPVDDVIKRLFGRVTYYEPPQEHDAPLPPTKDTVQSQIELGNVHPPQPPPSQTPPLNSESPQIKLPPGWSVEQDASGKTYYIDHINKRTSWRPPPSAR